MNITEYTLNETQKSAFGEIPAVGLDIGSRATKGVLLSEGKIKAALVPSGVSSKETANRVLDILLRAGNIQKTDVEYLVGTGYGRIALEIGDIHSQVLTEISCHAMGAYVLNPGTKTVIDIGGQDSKAIKVDNSNGKVIEFIMNDKCAAGTGRFLEKVAQLLNLTLEELGECALQAVNPAEISSQCVVFAESEVISLKARGVSREDIAAGIHLATARRVKTLLRKIGLEPSILFTGGVTNNQGMRKALEDVLETQLADAPFDTTFAGALGAAVYAGHFAAEKQAHYAEGL
ncbi:2-hydroxyglutaryl-CoA dehydratase [Spirochaetia bacterium]|nr:2-hydroxyglutaryl-CoA dehydratase [Spirochaetia bacterium]